MGWGEKTNPDREKKIEMVRPGNPSDARVESFIGIVTMMCACGSRRPLTIPAIPGAGAATQCQMCRVTWTIDSIEMRDAKRDQAGNVVTEPYVRIVPVGHLPAIAPGRVVG